jgi:hypothetical protein
LDSPVIRTSCVKETVFTVHYTTKIDLDIKKTYCSALIIQPHQHQHSATRNVTAISAESAQKSQITYQTTSALSMLPNRVLPNRAADTKPVQTSLFLL